MPYIIFILLTLVLSIVFDKQEYTTSKKWWYIFLCFYLILLSGLRNGVGGDTQCYMNDFDDVPTHPQDYGQYIMECIALRGYMPAWSMLNIICKQLFNSFYAVQLIEAFFVNICVFYLFKKYTSKIFLCVLLYGLTGYFFIFNTEVMREAFAICLCGIGMAQYLDGNKKTFYALVFVSLFFHLSALIVFIFPFIRLPKINIHTLLITFIVAFILWIASDYFIAFLIQFIEKYSSILSNKIISYADQKSNLPGFLELALRYIVGQAGIIYFVQYYKEIDDKCHSDYLRYFSFYLVIAILVCSIPGFYRFINYSILFCIIMMAEFLASIKIQLKHLALTKVVLVLIFTYYCGKYYLRIWPNNKRYHYEFFVPYTSIFDENVNTTYRYDMWYEAVHPEKNQKNSRSL